MVGSMIGEGVGGVEREVEQKERERDALVEQEKKVRKWEKNL